MHAWLTAPIGQTHARQSKHMDRISPPPRWGYCCCLTMADDKHALSRMHEFSGACACPKHKAAPLLSFQQQSLAILKPRPQSSWPTSTKRAASNVSDLVMEHGFCATSVASWATYASHAATKIRLGAYCLKMAHHRRDEKSLRAQQPTPSQHLHHYGIQGRAENHRGVAHSSGSQDRREGHTPQAPRPNRIESRPPSRGAIMRVTILPIRFRLFKEPSKSGGRDATRIKPRVVAAIRASPTVDI